MACVAVSLVDFRALRGACEMKLIRFGEMGREKPGVLLEDGTRLDVSGFGSDYDEDFFAGSGIAKLRNWLARQGASSLRVRESVRLGPPICRPSKIVCIGLNFQDHAEESGMEIPREPVIFFKATSGRVGQTNQLGMWLKVNGEFRQRGCTSKMIFDVPAVVAYISEFMTLLPGDVISTGTPPGVGLGMKPPLYLKAGDMVELGIDGLGESRQEVVDYR